MSRYRIYHVVHNPKGGWRVEGEKAKRPSSWHDTKDKAVDRGRELAKARKGQLKIHTQDGRIETEYSYGHDPSSSPG